MMKIKNKKALEDSLAVWVIVIFILVFLIFIYIGVIGIKKFSGDKIPEVAINSLGKNDLFLAQSFYGFLNTKTESSNSVKEDIYAWADGFENKDLIEKEFNDFFIQSNFECSIADINSNKNNKIRVFNLTKYMGPVYSPPHQQAFLDRGINFTLISDKNNLIKIRIYAGECKNGL